MWVFSYTFRPAMPNLFFGAAQITVLHAADLGKSPGAYSIPAAVNAAFAAGAASWRRTAAAASGARALAISAAS